MDKIIESLNAQLKIVAGTIAVYMTFWYLSLYLFCPYIFFHTKETLVIVLSFCLAITWVYSSLLPIGFFGRTNQLLVDGIRERIDNLKKTDNEKAKSLEETFRLVRRKRNISSISFCIIIGGISLCISILIGYASLAAQTSFSSFLEISVKVKVVELLMGLSAIYQIAKKYRSAMQKL